MSKGIILKSKEKKIKVETRGKKRKKEIFNLPTNIYYLLYFSSNLLIPFDIQWFFATFISHTFLFG